LRSVLAEPLRGVLGDHADVSVHSRAPRVVDRARRVERAAEPQEPERQAVDPEAALAVADGDLERATAEIQHGDTVRKQGRLGARALVREAALFVAGEDLHVDAVARAGERHELLTVLRVAERARADGGEAIHAVVIDRRGHLADGLERLREGLGRDDAVGVGGERVAEPERGLA
jgi:hypothetical protein